MIAKLWSSDSYKEDTCTRKETCEYVVSKVVLNRSPLRFFYFAIKQTTESEQPWLGRKIRDISWRVMCRQHAVETLYPCRRTCLTFRKIFMLPWKVQTRNRICEQSLGNKPSYRFDIRLYLRIVHTLEMKHVQPIWLSIFSHDINAQIDETK